MNKESRCDRFKEKKSPDIAPSSFNHLFSIMKQEIVTRPTTISSTTKVFIVSKLSFYLLDYVSNKSIEDSLKC